MEKDKKPCGQTRACGDDCYPHGTSCSIDEIDKDVREYFREVGMHICPFLNRSKDLDDLVFILRRNLKESRPYELTDFVRKTFIPYL